MGFNPAGVRKDRGRVLQRDKRRIDRDKLSKELHHKTTQPERKKRSSSSSSPGGGGKFTVAGMSPDQVLITFS